VPVATSTSSTPPNVPHHTVTRAIGRGSYGEIWLARSLTGAWRAVKIVERCRFEDSRAFDREFQGMAQFEPISREHHGFVDILHVGRSDDDAFFYYVMELADDMVPRPSFEPLAYSPKTLRSELLRVSRVPADEVVALGLSLTAALAALHRHGLVHRDIKPANIIFCGGNPKIADIGLVSAMGQDSFVGTEGYVPPEGPGTAQADLYSLGKVLYEIAMGKDRLDFPALNTSIDELPDRDTLMRLNDVLLRACNFDCRKRYVSADQMYEDLERVRDGRPLLGGPSSRRWWLPIAALLTVSAGGYAWYQHRPNSGGTTGGAGSILVQTEPADVGANYRLTYLDGKELNPDNQKGHLFKIGKSETGLRPGHYKATKIGTTLYDACPFEFDVKPGVETPPILLKLKRSVGAITIVSKTPDCALELQESGNSGAPAITLGPVEKGVPLIRNDIPTGAYDVVLKHGTQATKEHVDINRENPSTVEIGFKTRVFKITSEPAGAEISVDGQASGKKAPCELELIQGPHKLVGHYPKWPDQTQNIDDSSSDGVPFAFPTGWVRIITKPSETEIYDGVFVDGQPPPPKLSGTTFEDLDPGEVTYTIVLPSNVPNEAPKKQVRTAVVKPGEQTVIECRFDDATYPRRGAPWTNSLGMKFVPVGDFLMGIWPVRVSDYNLFCSEDGRGVVVDFVQGKDHPQVRVNWEDANAFCDWLTRRERSNKKIEDDQRYRLPTDAEWSAAAGMAPEGGDTPEQRDGRVRVLPWGKGWPPPPNSGNYADTAFKRGSGAASRTSFIPNYTDGFPQTSPVGSFPANRLGLFDMSGNVWQWVADPYGAQRKDFGVLRGGSWGTSKQEELRLGYRDVIDRNERDVTFGFRCVLETER